MQSELYSQFYIIYYIYIYYIHNLQIWLINFIPFLLLFQLHQAHRCKFYFKKNHHLSQIQQSLFIVSTHCHISDQLCSLCCFFSFKQSLTECARNGTSAPAATCGQVRAKHSSFCLIYRVKSSQKKQIQIHFFSSFLCCCLKDPTWNFLQCVGLPSTDTGRDHIQRLKQILEATMDVYTFMVRAWIKDEGMNARKNCRITSQSGLLLFPCH